MVTCYKQLGLGDLQHTPMLRMALLAYQAADVNRRAVQDPTIAHERVGITAHIVAQILTAGLVAPLHDPEYLRAYAAVGTAFIFFERGEDGSAPKLENICASRNSVDIAVIRRKSETQIAHTLTYCRTDSSSPTDLIFLYVRWRRTQTTQSPYYWAIPGHRLASSSARLTTQWFHLCLKCLQVRSPSEATWTSHSLRIGATSEAAALNVPLYRIRIWGDWSPSSNNVRDNIPGPAVPGIAGF